MQNPHTTMQMMDILLNMTGRIILIVEMDVFIY